MRKFVRDNAAFIAAIMSTSTDKIRLEIRQEIDRANRKFDPVFQSNQGDERFGEIKSQVGWLTGRPEVFKQQCPDLAPFIDKLLKGESDRKTETGYDIIDVGLVDPTFAISGKKVKLALRIHETTTPSEYDRDNPTRAKRMGEDGQWLVNEAGELIFSYTQVGYVVPDIGEAHFAGSGSAKPTIVKLAVNDDGHYVMPESYHTLVQYHAVVDSPQQAVIASDTVAAIRPPSTPSGAGDIVEDSPAKQKAQAESSDKEQSEKASVEDAGQPEQNTTEPSA